MKTRIIVFVLVLLWLLLPFLLSELSSPAAAYGLIWFLLHQLYYAPLGTWLSGPFFKPDSEIYFHVLPAGRALMAVFYSGLAFLAWKIWRRRLDARDLKRTASND